MMDKNVPYIAFEAEMARHERIVKRLLIALLISVVLLFVSNAAWLWFFSQFDISDTTVTLDSQDEGTNSYVGNDGDINYGEHGS
jgi:hypothetical protein